jgi:hypothetical protein
MTISEDKILDLRGVLYGDEIPLLLRRNPTSWRRRCTERIDLSSALWVERQRTIEVEQLRQHIVSEVNKRVTEIESVAPIVQDSVPLQRRIVRLKQLARVVNVTDCTHARLVLPVGQFIRAQRVDLGVTINGEVAYPVSRDRHLKIDMEYFRGLLLAVRPDGGQLRDFSANGAYDGPSLEWLLERLLQFSPARWNRFRAKLWSGRMAPRLKCIYEDVVSLNRYLYLGYLKDAFVRGELAPPWEENAATLWVEKSQLIQDRLKYWGYPQNRTSAFESPVLAIPFLIEYHHLEVRHINNLFDRLKDFLDTSRGGVGAGGPADLLLRTYACYGGYRNLFAECLVPLRSPFAIVVEEKRGFNFGNIENGGTIDPASSKEFSQRVRLLIPFKEARSSHVSVRIPDMNVELKTGSLDIRNEHNAKEKSPESITERKSADLFSFYSSRDDRSEKVWLTFKLRQTMSIKITLSVVWLMLIGTTITLFILGIPGRLSANKMTGILFPASIAAALLLTRGNSTLGMRVNRRSHLLTAILIIVLMAVGLGVFLTDICGKDCPGVLRLEWFG